MPISDRCTDVLVAFDAGGYSSHAKVINGSTWREIAGSSSANSSAVPCLPLFSCPGELGSHSPSLRLEKLGDRDRKRQGPRQQGHPAL